MERHHPAGTCLGDIARDSDHRREVWVSGHIQCVVIIEVNVVRTERDHDGILRNETGIVWVPDVCPDLTYRSCCNSELLAISRHSETICERDAASCASDLNFIATEIDQVDATKRKLEYGFDEREQTTKGPPTGEIMVLAEVKRRRRNGQHGVRGDERWMIQGSNVPHSLRRRAIWKLEYLDGTAMAPVVDNEQDARLAGGGPD
jgi:hypothetical protein